MQRRKPKSLQQTVGINLKLFTLWVIKHLELENSKVLRKALKLAKKIAKEAFKNEKVATTAGAGILGLIAGAIIKGLSK